MAKGKIFDEYLLIEFAQRLSDSDSAADKSGVIRWFTDMTGVSRGTAYRVKDKILAKVPLVQIAEAKQSRKKRKNDLEDARIKKDMFAIASLKNIQGADKRKIPTERAIQMAEGMGYIKKTYSRSTVDRHLAEMGLNARQANNRPFAHELTARYPFHVIAVDATPIDHYYLTLDMQVRQPGSLPPAGDKHLDDILKREGLYKIWVYYMVDLFSKAFLVMPFASLPKGANSKMSGENADDYFTFLKFCLLPKTNLESPLEGKPAPFRDCPIEGQPTILFCDKGSGIGGSKLIQNVFGNFGTKIVTHAAGSPSAKGAVEGRIGAFKRSYESLINPKVIKNINQLIYFYQSWTDYHNRKSGAYDRWREGIKDMPIRRLNEQNFQDAAVTYHMRTINGYGCVEIDKREFFVTPDEKYRGKKVQVYVSYACEGGRQYAALLGEKVIPLIAGRRGHDFEDIKMFPQSEGARNREEMLLGAKTIRSQQILDDILPQEAESKVVHLPHKNIITKEVHTPLIRDKFNSVDNAIDWLLTQNGLFLEEIPAAYLDTISNAFEVLLNETGSIAGDVVLKFSNAVAKYKKDGKIWQNPS